MSDTPAPQVFYIGGYGRSGSTLLHMFLGMHPSVIAVGEIARFFGKWQADDPCSCGQPLSSCSFWSRVYERYEAVIDIPADRAQKITNVVERFKFVRSAVGREFTEQYGRIWAAFLKAICDVSQRPIIADSSKTALARLRRPLALQRYTPSSVSLIHLVRDPRAVMWSIIKGDRKAVQSGQPPPPSGRAEKALASWVMTNVLTKRLYHSTLDRPVFGLRFEAFTREAHRKTVDLGATWSFDVTPLLQVLDEDVPISAEHVMAGNLIRHHGPLHIENQPETWRQKLPRRSKYAALLSYPVARRYGYFSAKQD